MVESRPRPPASQEGHQLLVTIFEFFIRTILICYFAFTEALRNINYLNSGTTRPPLADPVIGESDCNSSQRWYVVFVGREVGVFASS